ncbi:MAG: integrase core domain-containing protein [Polyangiaceae bacterium]
MRPAASSSAPFTQAWKTLLESGGVTSVPIPAHSPNCNPHAERFVKTVRTECTDHFLVFGQRHLRHLLKEYVAHYDAERYHQGIDGRLIHGLPAPSNDNGQTDAVQCRSRLGGLLNFYHRAAAWRRSTCRA